MSRLWFTVRSILSQYPILYQPYTNIAHPDNQKVDANTKLLIDGYCRCGISFFAEAFLYAQQEDINICWGRHSVAGIIDATKWEVPVLVLTRPPDEICVSQKTVNPQLEFTDILKGFVRFYSRLNPLRDSFVVATIFEVRSDCGSLIKRINRKFDTSFKILNHDAETERAIYEWIDQKATARHGGEIPVRDIMYAAYPLSRRAPYHKLAMEAYHADSKLRELRQEAEELYLEFTDGVFRDVTPPKVVRE